MTRETKVPSIPDIRDDNLKEVLRAIKSTLEVREGSIGDPLDQGATLRDLVTLNLAEDLGDAGGAGGLPVNPVIPPNPGGYNPGTDFTTPPAPTGLRTRGGFTNVFLEWDGAPYRNHNYTEIWRSQVNNIGTAYLIGTTAANVYADPADEDTTYYYWIRFVSKAAITGPYNQTTGTVAKTAIDVVSAIAALSEEITNSQLFVDLGTRINVVETGFRQISQVTATSVSQINTLASVVDGNRAAVQVAQLSVDGVRAQYTVKIDNNGHVSGFGLASTTVNGTPRSAFIVRADRFAIVGANSTIDPLGTLTPTKVPFMVFTTPTVIGGKTYPAGTWIDTAFIANATIDTAQIRDLTADKITAGTLTAAIGISTGYIAGGINTSYSPGSANFGNGFFLGNYGGSYQFYIGSPSQNVLWNGSSLSINGDQIINGNSIVSGSLAVNRIQAGTYTTQSGYNFGFGAGSVYQGIDFCGFFDTTRLGTAALGAFGLQNVAFCASTQSAYAAALFGNTNGTSGNFSGSGNNKTGASIANQTMALFAQKRTAGGSAFQAAPDANTLVWAKIAFNEGLDYAAQFYHVASGNYASCGTPSHGVYATSYGPFTGAHDALILKSAHPEPGDIVVDVRVVATKGVSDTITEIAASSTPNQKGAVGIYVQRTESVPLTLQIIVEVDRRNSEGKLVKTPVAELNPIYAPLLETMDTVSFNGLGEGLVNVCGEGGDIEKGDLIVTSSIPGKGMKQADDIVRSYTVARARESVVFASSSEVKQIACIYLCG
jgi:hypothetical protein